MPVSKHGDIRQGHLPTVIAEAEISQYISDAGVKPKKFPGSF